MEDQSLNKKLVPFEEKMERAGLPSIIIDIFGHYYSRLVKGERGLITGNQIIPLEENDIADMKTIDGFSEDGKKALKQAVIIKLNGGLGTSMGLSKAKSLIQVKQGINFLDIITRQVISWRERYGVKLPLVLMNSFSTEGDSLRFLEKYPDLASGVPLSFMQHKFPKVLRKNLSPVEWPRDPDCEWNPPGHGDIYPALVTSGMLKDLVDRGYRYAFISNSDNLCGVMNEEILGYFASRDLPFLMEVADRMGSDKKGGHLARLRRNGRLVLREIAQCPEEEIDEFQDVNTYKYFNTNNIWVNLFYLKEYLEKSGNILELPVIVNPKKVDPRDNSSPEAYQIETAMGSAVSVFEGSGAMKVPRTRFAPVKKTQDLLLLWSDFYILTDDFGIARNPGAASETVKIDLDERYYKRIDQLRERFSHGPPSLVECESLRVSGNVYFGKGIVIKGKANISCDSAERACIPDGKVIDRDLFL